MKKWVIIALFFPTAVFAQVLNSEWETQMGRMTIEQNGKNIQAESLHSDTTIQAEMVSPRIFEGKTSDGEDVILEFSPSKKEFVASSKDGLWQEEWQGSIVAGDIALTDEELFRQKIIQYPLGLKLLILLGTILLFFHYFLRPSKNGI